MSLTIYRILKDRIKTKLDGISQIQEVHDAPWEEFNGYPAATVAPTDGEVDFDTSGTDERAYKFVIDIFYETKSGTISESLDALYDVVDNVLDSFSQDRMFDNDGALNLPSGNTFIGVNPVAAGWQQVTDKNLLVATIELVLRVDITSS